MITVLAHSLGGKRLTGPNNVVGKSQRADKWIPALRRESDPVAVLSRAGRPSGRWPTRNDGWSWRCNLIGSCPQLVSLWL
jgi:hypothetical protein